ncbi:MAG: hypothetical protein RL324_2223 [Verrucomicrobiota bacterium]
MQYPGKTPVVSSGRRFRVWVTCLAAVALGGGLPALRAQGFLDTIDGALATETMQGQVRVQASGTLDLEGYQFSQPSPGLLFTNGHSLLNPRLSVYLDAELGRRLYAFAQMRVDRGFDPSSGPIRVRLDEYALRTTPTDRGGFTAQVGRFGTVVGSWVPRHGSWSNPFITAPLPYEALTGIWDTAAVRSPRQLLSWAHVPPAPVVRAEQQEKSLRVPILWGPAYGTGLAVAGRLGKIDVAAEWKNGSLSSDPGVWDDLPRRWNDGTIGGRLGYRPDAAWNFGLSASQGPYLRASAENTLLPGTSRNDYRQTVLGSDVSFAWHRWQVWSEVFASRFGIPGVTSANTYSGYVEASYRFGPSFSFASRWNRQIYDTIPNGTGGEAAWGRSTWRFDLAPSFRLSAHTQLKLQHSFQHETNAPHPYSQTTALQMTVRF